MTTARKAASTTPKWMANYKKDHEMVKGKFTFHEVPGGQLTFPFVKYRDDKRTSYTLYDGQVAEIPYMVAKHLNTKGRYPVHKHMLGEDGNYSQKVGTWVDRFTFQPIGFFDDEIQPTPNIVTVEKVASPIHITTR